MKILLTKNSIWARLGQIGSLRGLNTLLYAIRFRTSHYRQRPSRIRGNGSPCGGRESQGNGAVALAASGLESIVCGAGSSAAVTGAHDCGRNGEGAGSGGKRSGDSFFTSANLRKAAVFLGFAVSYGQAGKAGLAGRGMRQAGAHWRGGISWRRDSGGGVESITVGGPTGERTIHPD
jgi:hypothetical protein